MQRRRTVRPLRLALALALIALGLPWSPLGAVEDPKDPASTQVPEPTTEVEETSEKEADPAHSRRIEYDGKVTIFRIPISGMIDLGLAPFVERVAAEAAEAENGVLLLDIDTFGGRVDAAVLIRDALFEAEVPTIAHINPRAISAGALISLACNIIAISPGGTIGAATPITGGGTEPPEAVGEKFMSYMRTEFRATAERRGRDGNVAEAMVDSDTYVRGISQKGKLLTLTNETALKTGIADYEVESLDALLAELEIADSEVRDRELNWAEKIARVVTGTALTSMLLSFGMLGILMELYSPGWGIPGTIGVVCLTVFFLGHYVVNLAGHEEILLFFLGVVLLGIEVFVIPGLRHRRPRRRTVRPRLDPDVAGRSRPAHLLGPRLPAGRVDDPVDVDADDIRRHLPHREVLPAHADRAPLRPRRRAADRRGLRLPLRRSRGRRSLHRWPGRSADRPATGGEDPDRGAPP